MLAILFIFIYYLNFGKENLINSTSCFSIKSEDLCNQTMNCSWCQNAGWDTFSCYDTIDDCQCVKQVNYDDCIDLSQCHYCNLGAYGGRYCISKNVNCE